MTTDSIEKAAGYSKSRKAISKDRFIVRTKNGNRPAQIVISPGRSPVFVYASCPTIPVHEERPSSRQVDSVKEWEAY